MGQSKLVVQWEEMDIHDKFRSYYLGLTKDAEYVGIYAFRLVEGDERAQRYVKYRIPNEEIRQWVNEDPMFNSWSFNSLLHFFVEVLNQPEWLYEFKPYM